MDILALLMQCSVFFFMTKYQNRFNSYIDNVLQFTELAASLVLISLRYWENFLDRDICSFHIQSFKSSLMRGRCKTYIFASVWKIGLTLACAYMLIPKMTPMAVLFRYINNDTAYGNVSIDYDYNHAYDDYYYPPMNDSGVLLTPDGNPSPDVYNNGYNYKDYSNSYGDYSQNYVYNSNNNNVNHHTFEGHTVDTGNEAVPRTAPSLRFKRQAEENDVENDTSNTPATDNDYVGTNSPGTPTGGDYGGTYDEDYDENKVDYDVYQEYLDYVSKNKEYILQDEGKLEKEIIEKELRVSVDDVKDNDDIDSYDVKGDDSSQNYKEPSEDKVENNGKIKIIKKIRKKKIKTTERPSVVEINYE